MGNKQAALASPQPGAFAAVDEAAPPPKYRKWSRRKCVGPAAAATGATRRFAALPFRKKGPVPFALSQPSSTESAPPLSDPTPPPSELTPVISQPVPLLPESPTKLSAPLLPESGPLVSESALLVSESPPLVSESAPLVSESAPLVSESPPLVSESAPLVSESALPLSSRFGDCMVTFSDTAVVVPLKPEKSLAESYGDIPYIDDDDDVELDAVPAAQMTDGAEAHYFTEDLRWSLTLLGAYPCLAEGEDFPEWAPSAASNKLKGLPHQRLVSLFGTLRIGKESRS